MDCVCVFICACSFVRAHLLLCCMQLFLAILTFSWRLVLLHFPLCMFYIMFALLY